jgi:hypothetical protein
MMPLEKRPISVWIALIVIALLGLLFIFAWFVMLVAIVKSTGGFNLGILAVTVLYLGFLLGLSFSFFGLQKRKTWGRWLSIGVLLVVWFIFLTAQVAQTDGPIKRYEYSNSTERMAGMATSIAISAGMLALPLTLVFSRKVRAYFQQAAGQSIGEPPPPPQF